MKHYDYRTVETSVPGAMQQIQQLQNEGYRIVCVNCSYGTIVTVARRKMRKCAGCGIRIKDPESKLCATCHAKITSTQKD